MPEQRVLVGVRIEDPGDTGEADWNMPAAPMSSSVLRPSLSISDMPTMVKMKLVAPMAMACWSLEIWLKPAAAKMLLR